MPRTPVRPTQRHLSTLHSGRVASHHKDLFSANGIPWSCATTKLLAWAMQVNYWPGLPRVEETGSVEAPHSCSCTPPGNTLTELISRGNCGKLVENRSMWNVRDKTQLEGHLQFSLCPSSWSRLLSWPQTHSGIPQEAPNLTSRSVCVCVPVITHLCALLWTHTSTLSVCTP